MLVPHTCSDFTAAKILNEDVRGYLVLNYDAHKYVLLMKPMRPAEVLWRWP